MIRLTRLLSAAGASVAAASQIETAIVLAGIVIRVEFTVGGGCGEGECAEHLPQVPTAVQMDNAIVLGRSHHHRVFERQDLEKAASEEDFVTVGVKTHEFGVERPLVRCHATLPGSGPTARQIHGAGDTLARENYTPGDRQESN